MSVRTYAAAALLTSGSWLAIGLSTPAFAVCDAYSGGCPTAPPTDVGGGTENPATGGGNENPATGGGTENPATGGGTENPATGGGTENPATGGGTENPATGGGTAGGGATGGGTAGGGATGGGGGTVPATLPFTGGELVLMTAIGAGALAGGTALVLAGRRKAAPTA